MKGVKKDMLAINPYKLVSSIRQKTKTGRLLAFVFSHWRGVSFSLSVTFLRD